MPIWTYLGARWGGNGGAEVLRIFYEGSGVRILDPGV
jgi:hypothetical protein